MLLEAILTKKDLQRIAGQFVPADVQIGDGAKLSVEPPLDVELVPDEGIRVSAKAKVHWPVLGLQVPLEVHPLTVMVTPGVASRPEGDTLVLRLRVERADVVFALGLLDEAVTARVNDMLVKRHVELAWNFREALTHVFDLPEALESSGAFALEVARGVVKVTADAVGFAVSFDAGVRARTAESTAARRKRVPSSPRVVAHGLASGLAGRNGHGSTTGHANGEGKAHGPSRGIVLARRVGQGSLSRTTALVAAAPAGAWLAAGSAVAGLALAAAFGLGRMSRR